MSENTIHFTIINLVSHGANALPFEELVDKIGVPNLRINPRNIFDLVKAWAYLSRNNFDLIQSHSTLGHLLAMAASRSKKIPWISFAHGYSYGPMWTHLCNFIDWKLLKSAPLQIGVSQDLAKRLAHNQHPGKKVAVVQNCIDPEELPWKTDSERGSKRVEIRKKYGISDDLLTIGCIGRLSPEKGHIFLLQSLHELTSRVEKFKLLMVGTGPEEKTLREAVRNYKLENQVIFVGHEDDPMTILLASDILVHPSLSEGIPNVILEASLSSVPVIASAVGGIPEVIEDNRSGILVPAKNVPELTRAISTLMNNPTLRNEIAFEANKRVKESFHVAQRARKLLSIYEETTD